MTLRTVALDVDADILNLAVDELRSAADRRRTVAERASGELTAAKRDDPKLDIRTGAMHVVRTLGEADDLRALADMLHNAAAGLPTGPQPGLRPTPPSRPDPDDASRPAAASPDASPAAADDGTDPAPGEPDVPLDAHSDPDVLAMRALLGLESTFDGDEVPDVAAVEAAAAIAAPELDLDGDDAPSIPVGGV